MQELPQALPTLSSFERTCPVITIEGLEPEEDEQLVTYQDILQLEETKQPAITKQPARPVRKKAKRYYMSFFHAAYRLQSVCKMDEAEKIPVYIAKKGVAVKTCKTVKSVFNQWQLEGDKWLDEMNVLQETVNKTEQSIDYLKTLVFDVQKAISIKTKEMKRMKKKQAKLSKLDPSSFAHKFFVRDFPEDLKILFEKEHSIKLRL